MIRLVLQALNAPAMVLFVGIGVALQTSLFTSYPLNYLQPDVILIAVIWCSLRRGFVEGGILTLLFADIAEIHSASPAGVLLVTYMGVFLMVRLASKLVVITGMTTTIILTLAASIFWKFAYLAVLLALGAGSNQWRHLFSLLFPGAVMEGLIGIWLYRWLDRFDWVTYKSDRARQMLEDELQLDSEGL